MQTVPFGEAIDFVPNCESDDVIQNEDHFLSSMGHLCLAAIRFRLDHTKDYGEKSILHAHCKVLYPDMNAKTVKFLSIFPLGQFHLPWGGLLFIHKVTDAFVSFNRTAQTTV